MLGRALLLAVSLSDGLLITEGMLRLFVGPPAFFLFTGPFRDVQTDWDVSYGVARDQTRRSFRQLSDDAPTRRIAVVGDSFVFREGVADDEVFASRLNRDFGTVGVVVDNFGIIGANLRNYAVVIRDLVDDRHTDLVLLVYGNDFIDGYYRPTLRGQLARLPEVSSLFSLLRRAVNRVQVASFRRKLAAQIPNNPTSILDRDPRYFVRAVDPTDVEIAATIEHLGDILGKLQKRHPHIKIWLAIVPEASTVSARFRAFISNYTKELPKFGAPGKAYEAIKTVSPDLGESFIDTFPTFSNMCEDAYFPEEIG